jgi:hypothetical protein
MKRNLSAKNLLVTGLLGLALSASAQTMTTTTPNPTSTTSSGSAYGLIGEHYTGLRFGYTDVDDGPPNVMHSYGFVASRPTLPYVDAVFKYEYLRASAAGLRNRQHTAAAGGTAYLTYEGVKPFIEGNLGWVFQRADAGRKDSFMFFAAVGAEIQVKPQLVVTPFVSYEEAPRFDKHVWKYGAKATYRIAREWSGSLSVQVDEDGSVEYGFGINRHF